MALINIDSKKKPIEFDSSQCVDDMARRIAWSPLKGGGASFRTKKLIKNQDKIAFKTSIFVYLFAAVFIILGVGIPVSFIIFEPFPSLESGFPWFEVLFAALFVIVGLVVITPQFGKIVFDTQSGQYVKKNVLGESHIPLSDIYSLQIISEYVKKQSQDDHSYYSYELNIVTKDGLRLNVIDHGNLESLRADAQEIATLLNVPLWDTTNPNANF
jgi:hypothetical protein